MRFLVIYVTYAAILSTRLIKLGRVASNLFCEQSRINAGRVYF